MGGVASVWGLEADMRTETRTRGPPDRGTRPPRLGRPVQVIMLWARQTLWYEIIYTSSITKFIYEDYEVTINPLLPLGRYINMDPYTTGLLIHCEVRGIISSWIEIHSDF